MQVRGLCGDMDGSHSGDFMSRAGIEEHLVAFAMSYSSCQDLTPTVVNYTQPEPCSLDRSVCILARQTRARLYFCRTTTPMQRRCPVSVRYTG